MTGDRWPTRLTCVNPLPKCACCAVRRVRTLFLALQLRSGESSQSVNGLFSEEDGKKIVAQIRGVFRKIINNTPRGSNIWPKMVSSHPDFVFTPVNAANVRCTQKSKGVLMNNTPTSFRYTLVDYPQAKGSPFTEFTSITRRPRPEPKPIID